MRRKYIILKEIRIDVYFNATSKTNLGTLFDSNEYGTDATAYLIDAIDLNESFLCGQDGFECVENWTASLRCLQCLKTKIDKEQVDSSDHRVWSVPYFPITRLTKQTNDV